MVGPKPACLSSLAPTAKPRVQRNRLRLWVAIVTAAALLAGPIAFEDSASADETALSSSLQTSNLSEIGVRSAEIREQLVGAVSVTIENPTLLPSVGLNIGVLQQNEREIDALLNEVRITLDSPTSDALMRAWLGQYLDRSGLSIDDVGQGSAASMDATRFVLEMVTLAAASRAELLGSSDDPLGFVAAVVTLVGGAIVLGICFLGIEACALTAYVAGGTGLVIGGAWTASYFYNGRQVTNRCDPAASISGNQNPGVTYSSSSSFVFAANGLILQLHSPAPFGCTRLPGYLRHIRQLYSADLV